jgi:hypothetical protein
MGIEDILRKKDERRGRGDARQDAYEREYQARFVYSERVAAALLSGLIGLRDKAIGEAVRLPIAAKPSEPRSSSSAKASFGSRCFATFEPT